MIRAAFMRGFRRGLNPPRPVDPGPILIPDEHGMVHVHVNANGVMPPFQVQQFMEDGTYRLFRGVVVHGPVPTWPGPW